MSQDTNVNNLIINTLTKAQFDTITPSATELYLVTDDSGITGSDVVTALGYTPYDGSTNPNGYVTSDTKNTAGTTNNTGTKLFLAGATSQGANPQTYSNSNVFIDTNNRLNSAAPASNANDTTVATTKWVKDQGYTSNTGTVTSVNNVSPVSGNVTLSIPTVTDTYSATSSNAMSGKAVASALSNSGFITGINSSDVTTALGYTPYNGATNPNGYTSNVGTVTKVNNVSPDSSGNVSLTIPTVNNATLTIQKNGTTVKTFTANASSNVTCNITVPTVTDTYSSTSTEGMSGKAVASALSNSGFITGITSGDVTTALGYTPYNSSNPSGYVTTDTKYTAGSSNSTSKLFLIGATAQGTAATNAQAKTTYSNSAVYAQNGYLYATTPASTTNNTTVATTKFVKDQGYTSNAGTITGITMNGTSMGTSGVVNLGTVITDISGKQDTLVSGTNIKTINNTSILGSGNIDTKEVFVVYYNQTTYQDVVSAVAYGKVIYCIDSTEQGTFDGIKAQYVCAVSANADIVFTGTYNNKLYTYTINTSNVWTKTITKLADTDLSNLSTTGQAVIDNSIKSILELMYPVGAIFIGTTSTCPMAQFFGTWSLVAGDRVLQGSSSNHAANSNISAGLPNITGEISSTTNQMKGSTDPSASGALSINQGSVNSSGYQSASGNSISKISFSAKNSNSIYGSSSTVQPPAYVVNVWRRTA